MAEQAFIRVNMGEVERLLPSYLSEVARKQVPFATALALTRVAKESKETLRQEMTKRFDRPTPFTLNSVFHKAADKRKAPISALVWLKDFAGKGTPAAQYLLPQIYGLQRGYKRFERLLHSRGILPTGRYVVPGQYAELDKYGNIKGSLITKILTALQAQTDQYQNESSRSFGRKAKKNPRYGGYTVFRPGNGRTGKPRGVYQVSRFAFGDSLRPVLVFARKRPSYRVRLPFIDIVTRNLPVRFEREFGPALAQALETAGKKSAKRFDPMPVARR